jgi:hypothetical protein
LSQDSPSFREEGELYLSSETEHFEQSKNLSSPELNPLLNPILAENMGRWAEVYFTNPPERREQAVLELLHELQGRNIAPDGAPVTSTPDAAPGAALQPASEIPDSSVRCDACGRENPASHRFCGMCGRPVAAQDEVTDHPVVDLHTQHLGADRVISDTTQDLSAQELPRDERYAGRSQEAVFTPAPYTNGLSLFQGGSEAAYGSDGGDESFSDQPASRPYRVYVGIALATVFLALAYMAWRSAQATSQSSHQQPEAPPAVTQRAVSTPDSPAPTKPVTRDGIPPSTKQAAIPSTLGPGNEDRHAKTADDKGGRPLSTLRAAQNPPSTLSRNGTAELAIAQDYLTGANGEPRNSAEAAKWLWKSMAKHNAEATLLLADLYLKGDGVDKNCDQAHVLLDSAASGGMKQAGERLRHLQAFGCQ